ncbi:MAG: hypothetical protein R3C05_28370 [Pirellulaceae bacterium]
MKPIRRRRQIGAASGLVDSVLSRPSIILLNSGAENDCSIKQRVADARAFLVAALFIVLSSAVMLRFLDEVRRLPSSLTRRNHVVICGLGQMGCSCSTISMRASRPERHHCRRIRPILVCSTREDGGFGRRGDSTKVDTLMEVRSAQAAEIFVVNGDGSANLEVTAELGRLGDGIVYRI